MANRSRAKGKSSARTDTSAGTRAPGDAAEGPATRGTLSSGYSSCSATGGTGGGVLQQRGTGYSPGADSREGAYENEADPLGSEGVTAGAAGIAEDRHGKPAGEPADAEKNDEYAQRPDGAAAVTGVSGVSGGGRGTTRSGNTRK